ncbi:MAG: 4Fe-4S binding protein [Thermoanaerobaculia bacterium]|nr:4Fe-4S binding protein [Thermoanaerobaculia bacterium]
MPYPVIDFDACVGDQICIETCPEKVLDWDDAEGKLRVTSQEKCPPGCQECVDICPLEAIQIVA